MAKYGTFKYGTAKYNGDILWLFYRNINDILNDTSRNYLNYDDLNRIEKRMAELTYSLNELKYSNKIITKTDWTKQLSTSSIDNIPVKQQLQRIRDNLNNLVYAYYVYNTTPKPLTTLENLTIYKVNDMEKILFDLNIIIKSMKDSFKLCGITLCGGVSI